MAPLPSQSEPPQMSPIPAFPPQTTVVGAQPSSFLSGLTSLPSVESPRPQLLPNLIIGDQRPPGPPTTTFNPTLGTLPTTMTVGPAQLLPSLLLPGSRPQASHPIAASSSSHPPPPIVGMISAAPGGHGFPASGGNPTVELLNSYARIHRLQQEGRRRPEGSTRNREETFWTPRGDQLAQPITTTTATETAQDLEIGGHF